MTDTDEMWVPQACTLPTEDRPLRLSEFDELFATSLRGLGWVSPTVLRWALDPAAEEGARDLTARETECCSFFSFAFALVGDDLMVEVQVPPAQVAVLDALASRATALTSR